MLNIIIVQIILILTTILSPIEQPCRSKILVEMCSFCVFMILHDLSPADVPCRGKHPGQNVHLIYYNVKFCKILYNTVNNSKIL